MDQQDLLIDRFTEALISGDRPAARAVVDECLDADAPGEAIIEKLFWPTLEQIQRLFCQDQVSVLSHHLATRLLRMLADQMQLRLEQHEPTGRTMLMICGPNEPNELAAQMAADVLEAAGHTMHFAGGGIANDEIIHAVGNLEPEALIIFSSAPQDLPYVRALIDELRATGLSPQTQVVVGGGVYNRAEGLPEEIGADLWAKTPAELVRVVREKADRRMPGNQRTVGRNRRKSRAA